MELSQNQRLNQTQSQEQTLSHAQMQSLQVLHATNLELRDMAQTLCQTNPVVEMVSPGNEILMGNPLEDVGGPTGNEEERRAQLADYDENMLDYVKKAGDSDGSMDGTYLPNVGRNSGFELGDESADEADRGREDDEGERWDSGGEADDAQRSSGTAEDEERRQHFFESLTGESSMYVQLVEDARERAGQDYELAETAEIVIGNLDEKGYLRATDVELAVLAGVTEETAQRAVELVQSLEPVGIGSRTWRECLLRQLEHSGEKGSTAWRIVDQYLEDLGRNRIPVIARELRKSVADINAAVERIRELEPFPGRELYSSTSPVVVPEAVIYRGQDGEWDVLMNKGIYPVLSINEEYRAMAERPETEKATRTYLKEHIRSANEFMQALDGRQRTIERITWVLVARQQEFLEEGVAKLRPLVMTEVAQELELSDSTVSRAIAGKYVRTPHGLFEYRYFFSTGVTVRGTEDEGEELSSRAIRQKIRELVNREDPGKPLSDQKIAELLEKDGLKVARRTVAKYREAEGIPATSLRRLHG